MLYGEHAGATFGFLVRALGDRQLAEDVQQQVFLQAWQRAEQYDPERGGLRTWLLTIARSRAVDQLRRRVPEPRDPGAPATLSIPDGRAEREIDQRLEALRMADHLATLPDELAGLLRLRFHDGLTQREISVRTGVPLGTVKTRMVTALERLRTALEEESRT